MEEAARCVIVEEQEIAKSSNSGSILEVVLMTFGVQSLL